MAYGSTLIGKIQLGLQTGWGTAKSSWAATDVVECELFLPARTQEVIAPETYRGGYYQQSTQGGSKAGAEVQIKMPLLGVSGAAPTADPTPHYQAYLMRDALGSLASDGYQTDVTTGGTSTSVVVTTGVEAHAGFAVAVPKSGGYAIGWISDHTANTYTVSPLGATPSSSGTLYGSSVAYLSTATPADGWTLIHNADVVGGTTYYDGVVTRCAIVSPAKGQPMMEVTIRFASWSDVSAAAIVPYAYSYPQMPPAIGAHGARGTDALTGECFSSSTFEATVEADAIDCYSSDQGVSLYRVVDRKVRWTLDAPIAETAQMYAVGASYGGVEQLDLCSTPGRACSIFMGSPTVVEHSQMVALGKVIGQRVTLAPGNYTGDTETTAPADTAVRVAWL